MIGLQIAIASLLDFRLALSVDDLESFSDESRFASVHPSPAVQREILLAQRGGMQSAIASIRNWRLGVEALLGAGALAVFVIALRMRLATEGRAELATLLGRVALATAVVRVIDGAQDLVIKRTWASAVGEVLAKHPPTSPDEPNLGVFMEPLAGAQSIGASLMVVSILMGLATYFRSENLRDLLIKTEG
ncbi:MAG: hypothetical protein JNM17_37960 [Archangium sp.]|nr:hypothetical protein [Archangium sp.]